MTTQQHEPRLRLWIDGVELPNAGDRVLELEIEESTEAASRFTMAFDMNPEGDGETGDWDLLVRNAFTGTAGPFLQLMSRISIGFVLSPDAGTGQDIADTVFDGYVTEMHPRFGPARVGDSRLEVSGLDASCLLHFQTVTKTWSGRTDAEIATEIFGKYGFVTDATTIEPTSPVRDLVRGAMVQRCTDAEFLRLLARRNGFECYVELAPGEIEPGPHAPGQSRGHFHRPRADAAEVQPALQLFPLDAPSLIEFDATWDSHRPTRMRGWRLDEVTRLVERIDTDEPGQTRLGSTQRAVAIGERLGMIAFGGASAAASGAGTRQAGDPALNVLEASEIFGGFTPHHSTELAAVNTAAMRDADWFVEGCGVVRAERYPAILRPRRPVAMSGAGTLLDGTWYCRSVCHRWARNGHLEPGQESAQVSRRYEADIRLVRHALGADAGAAAAAGAAS